MWKGAQADSATSSSSLLLRAFVIVSLIGGRTPPLTLRVSTLSRRRGVTSSVSCKAGKSDVSAKDFVLFAGQGLQQLEGRRLNTTSWLSQPTEPAQANASRLPDEKDTWLNN